MTENRWFPVKEKMSKPSARKLGRPPGSNGAVTRGRILRSARALFSTVGYRDATPAEIAEDAGVTRSTIYRYFPSKSDLYAAVFESMYPSVIDRMRTQTSAHTALVDQVATVFRVCAALNHEDPTYARFAITSLVDGLRYPELTNQAREQIGEMRDFFLVSVDRAIARGELPSDVDSRVIGDMLVAILCGMGLFSAIVGTERETDDATEMLVRFLAGELSAASGRVLTTDPGP
ncbi:transcriptional regulator, TetR family [Candidatus Protofrankia datiscae]|uniref:Transcriptional regulator, TetR family n=2 Tax=Frankiaceae TaxID=74712 RepID=F8AY78_9ACTN|nr:transcriptional regulator, TetR family [Candidatus Protofrankia datiscae]